MSAAQDEGQCLLNVAVTRRETHVVLLNCSTDFETALLLPFHLAYAHREAVYHMWFTAVCLWSPPPPMLIVCSPSISLEAQS